PLGPGTHVPAIDSHEDKGGHRPAGRPRPGRHREAKRGRVVIALVIALAVMCGVFIPYSIQKDREDMREPKHRAEPDGAPQTREEVRSGWTPPGYDMQQAYEQKQELKR